MRISTMKIVIAIDSFKESLTSLEAGDAIRTGILEVMPDADVEVCPLADGGEGTMEALTLGMGGRIQKVTVTGPAGHALECEYGIVGDDTAILEMASAAGLMLVGGEERNPMRTTTYGVGEMIRDAINKGCRRFIVGIGGSATNDAGIGMLQALGFDFLDAKGKQVSYGAEGVRDVVSISTDRVMPELKECTFLVACDVNNPLCGPKGCSATFGPQKGAAPQMVEQMDGWLKSFSELVKKEYPDADPNLPGCGAAGGMGYGFLVFTNAVLKSGISIVLDEIKLEEKIKDADIVITGEGRLDFQTVMGKAPIGVAKLAKRHGKKVIAFAGCVTEDAVACNDHGIDAYFPIVRGIVTLEEALNKDNARANMVDTVRQVFRLL